MNNLRVLDYLVNRLGADAEQKLVWYRHWIIEGLACLEALLAGNPQTGSFCHGDQPTLADCCLIPQLYNARSFDCPLDSFPAIRHIEAHCSELQAFQDASPENQPDAE